MDSAAARFEAPPSHGDVAPRSLAARASRPVRRAYEWLVPSAILVTSATLRLALDGLTALEPRQTAPIAAGVAAAALAIWLRWGRRRVIPRRFGVVEPDGLFRSGQLDRAIVRRWLVAHRIDLIVNLTSEGFGDPDKDAERRAATELGIQRLTFHLDGDGLGDVATYTAALRTVLVARCAGRKVLVHCAAGSFRTGVAVGLYRCVTDGLESEEFRQELRAFGVGRRKVERLLEYVERHGPAIRSKLRAEANLG